MEKNNNKKIGFLFFTIKGIIASISIILLFSFSISIDAKELNTEIDNKTIINSLLLKANQSILSGNLIMSENYYLQAKTLDPNLISSIYSDDENDKLQTNIDNKFIKYIQNLPYDKAKLELDKKLFFYPNNLLLKLVYLKLARNNNDEKEISKLLELLDKKTNNTERNLEKEEKNNDEIEIIEVPENKEEELKNIQLHNTNTSNHETLNIEQTNIDFQNVEIQNLEQINNESQNIENPNEDERENTNIISTQEEENNTFLETKNIEDSKNDKNIEEKDENKENIDNNENIIIPPITPSESISDNSYAYVLAIKYFLAIVILFLILRELKVIFKPREVEK